MTINNARTNQPDAVPDHSWFPVALTASVDAGTSAGIRLNGAEIAVWRDAADEIHAFEDRCPHRGMRLSLGFVRKDHIACLYHGWQYDKAGQCRYIPAHPNLEVPKTIAVPVHACIEWTGMIFIRASSGTGQPGPVDLPAQEALPVRSLYLDLSPGDVLPFLRHALQSAIFGADAGEIRIRPLSPSLLAVDLGNACLLLGVHASTERRTALHVVILGPRTDTQLALRRVLLSRLPRLRRLAQEFPPSAGQGDTPMIVGSGSTCGISSTVEAHP